MEPPLDTSAQNAFTDNNEWLHLYPSLSVASDLKGFWKFSTHRPRIADWVPEGCSWCWLSIQDCRADTGGTVVGRTDTCADTWPHSRQDRSPTRTCDWGVDSKWHLSHAKMITGWFQNCDSNGNLSLQKTEIVRSLTWWRIAQDAPLVCTHSTCSRSATKFFAGPRCLDYPRTGSLAVGTPLLESPSPSSPAEHSEYV